MRLVGVLLGFVGVGVLTGLHPEGGWWAVAGHARGRPRLALIRGRRTSTRQHRFSDDFAARDLGRRLLGGGDLLLPFALAQLPDQVPSWKALGSVAALGLLGSTAFAHTDPLPDAVRLRAARTSLVTYLLPPFALFYGAVFLDEQVAVNAALGLVLILAGVALGSGLFQLVGRGRDETAPATPHV